MTGRPVYIVDGSRTPFIRARGRPGPFTPVDLTVACGKPLLLRQPFAPEALSPIYKKPAEVHQFFQEFGETRAAS